jgi:predicted nucleic acid-binding Zn ribbon protein
MNDEFFDKKNCDRCGNILKFRTMSWFNEETICMTCSEKEQEIKKQLPESGKNYEGCGYIPEIKKEEVSDEEC